MKIVILSYVYLPNSFAIILSYVYIPNSYSLPVVSPMETVILSSFSTMICIAFPLILEFDTVMLLFYQWPRCYERNTVTAFNDNDTFYSNRCIFFLVCVLTQICVSIFGFNCYGRLFTWRAIIIAYPTQGIAYCTRGSNICVFTIIIILLGTLLLRLMS